MMRPRLTGCSGKESILLHRCGLTVSSKTRAKHGPASIFSDAHGAEEPFDVICQPSLLVDFFMLCLWNDSHVRGVKVGVKNAARLVPCWNRLPEFSCTAFASIADVKTHNIIPENSNLPEKPCIFQLPARSYSVCKSYWKLQYWQA